MLEFASKKSINKEINMGCTVQNENICLFVTFKSCINLDIESSDEQNTDDELFAGTNILLAKALSGHINGNLEIITSDDNTKMLLNLPISLLKETQS